MLEYAVAYFTGDPEAGEYETAIYKVWAHNANDAINRAIEANDPTGLYSLRIADVAVISGLVRCGCRRCN